MEPAWTAARRDEAEARAEHPCHAGGSPGNRRRRVAPKPGLRPLPETVRRSRRLGRQRKARRGHYAAMTASPQSLGRDGGLPITTQLPHARPALQGAVGRCRAPAAGRGQTPRTPGARRGASPPPANYEKRNGPSSDGATVAGTAHGLDSAISARPRAVGGWAGTGILRGRSAVAAPIRAPTGLVEDGPAQLGGSDRNRNRVPCQRRRQLAGAWTRQLRISLTCPLARLSTSRLSDWWASRLPLK